MCLVIRPPDGTGVDTQPAANGDSCEEISDSSPPSAASHIIITAHSCPVVGKHQAVAVARSCLDAACAPKRITRGRGLSAALRGAVCGTVGCVYKGIR